jgi:hypothetical protein
VEQRFLKICSVSLSVLVVLNAIQDDNKYLRM